MERFTNAAFSFEVTDTPAAGRDGPERVAILLHGFLQDRLCWDCVTPALAGGGYRVLAPDLRGYSPGARPAARSAYRNSQLAADVLALAAAAGAGSEPRGHLSRRPPRSVGCAGRGQWHRIGGEVSSHSRTVGSAVVQLGWSRPSSRRRWTMDAPPTRPAWIAERD